MLQLVWIPGRCLGFSMFLGADWGGGSRGSWDGVLACMCFARGWEGVCLAMPCQGAASPGCVFQRAFLAARSWDPGPVAPPDSSPVAGPACPLRHPDEGQGCEVLRRQGHLLGNFIPHVPWGSTRRPGCCSSFSSPSLSSAMNSAAFLSEVSGSISAHQREV